MSNVIISLLIVSALSIWLFGWLGVFAIALFLLGAYWYSQSGKAPGRIERFVEKLGTDEDKKTPGR